MTVPKTSVERSTLTEGSTMVEAPARKRYRLAELMAQMPSRLPRAAGWEDMLAVGKEKCVEAILFD